MRKIWKITKWVLLGVAGVLVVAVVALAVTGVPKLGSMETKNMPRVGWSNLPPVFRTMNSMEYLMPVGFTESGDLEYGKMSMNGIGLHFYRPGTGEVEESGLTVPFGKLLKRIPGKGDRYLYLFDPVGDEQDVLNIFDRETGLTETLLEGTYAVYHYKFSPDGSFVVAYDLDIETGVNKLVKIDLEGGADPKVLGTFEGNLLVEDFDSGLEHVYVIQTEDDKAGRLYRVDMEEGSREVVFPEERDARFYHGNYPAWYAEQGRFALTRNDSLAYYARTGGGADEKEFVALWEVNVYSGESRRISPVADADVWALGLSFNERFVVYLLVEKSYPALMAYDRETGSTRELYADREDIVMGALDQPFLLSPDRNRVYFATISLEGQGLVEADLETGSVKVLDRTYDPETADSGIAFTDFEFSAADSTVGVMTGIHSYLYTPKKSDDGPLPVLVNFHGGADLNQSPFMLDPLDMILLEKGFAVIKPQYRGTWGYGNSFEQADDGYKRQDQVRDMAGLLDWIREHPELDEDRIVLFGVSWGGYMVVESMIMYPDAFASGLSMLGVLDLRSLGEDRFLRGWSPGEVGDPLADPELGPFLDGISPCYNAGKVSRPLYILQGGIDPRVPPVHARKTLASLDAAGREYWYAELPDTGHSMFGSPPDMAYMVLSILEFVDRSVE